MNANPVLLQKKYARIIENFARKKHFNWGIFRFFLSLIYI